MKQDNVVKGRILRVKSGYNPNSSSVGSQIPAFFAYAVGTGAVAIITSQIFNMIKDRIIRKEDFDKIEKQQ
jgi:hypothetical protein